MSSFEGLSFEYEINYIKQQMHKNTINIRSLSNARSYIYIFARTDF